MRQQASWLRRSSHGVCFFNSDAAHPLPARCLVKAGFKAVHVPYEKHELHNRALFLSNAVQQTPYSFILERLRVMCGKCVSVGSLYHTLPLNLRLRQRLPNRGLTCSLMKIPSAASIRIML